MAAHDFKTLTLLLLLHALGVFATFTNLPDVPPGVFNVSTRIEIKSTKHAAWHALTDFAGYPDWNPFVRAAVMVSKDNTTLPYQYPKEGRRLFLRTQLPPLPIPVTRDTPDIELHTQYALENVTHVEPRRGRLAWVYISDTSIQSERWSAVSDLGRGKVLYESREVFSGPLAEYLKSQLEVALQGGFDSQGKALKLHLEKRE
jgi:hypothetical protein